MFSTPINMSANFSLEFWGVCQLFETLSTSTSQHQNDTIIQLWFQQYDAVIDRKGPGGVALLSCLLPKKRADHVYGLSRARLESIIAESQGFGHSRLYKLRRLQDRDGLDLALATEQSLAVTDEPAACT
jgi:hypothetical protein